MPAFTLRFTIKVPSSNAPLLAVTLIDYVLSYQTKPSEDALHSAPPGAIVTLQIEVPDSTAPGGKTTTTLSWTAETFHGLNGALKQKVRPGILEIQFTQRCLLTTSGIASWRLHFWDRRTSEPGQAPLKVPLTYNLTSQDSFDPGNPLVPLEVPVDGTPLSFLMRNNQGEISSNQKFIYLLATFEHQRVVAEIDPILGGQLCYRAEQFGSGASGLKLGNGLVLQADDMRLWQYTLYDLSAAGVRRLQLGVDRITTTATLTSWNEGVARRFYEGLSVDHQFTFVPELTLEANADLSNQPLWTAFMSVTENLSLKDRPDRFDWYRQDGIEEYPKKSNFPGPTGHPDLSKFNTRVTAIRIMEQEQADTRLDHADVVGTFRLFRTQDGTPVTLTGLALTTPAKSAEPLPWSFTVGGSDAGQVPQIVRAGAFELRLGPKNPKTNFTIVCSADYQLTTQFPVPFPLMPLISCTIDSLPLLDVVPAGEDDLDKDQYAQLNAGTASPASPDGVPSSRDPIRQEINRNMQGENFLVFRNPARPAGATDDGTWTLNYQEQTSFTAKQFISMHLLFTAHPGLRANGTEADESVLVLDRSPFMFADVHFNPLKNGSDAVVADWNSLANEWTIRQIKNSPSYLVMPPQIVAEENITADANDNFPSAKPPRMALGTPTVVTYKPDPRTEAAKVPWDLRRLLTDRTLDISRLDYEVLYGLASNTTAAHMRLTEAATLYGALLQEFPDRNGTTQADQQYLYARLHWSRIYREYQSRLGVYVVQDGNSADPETFSDTTETVAQLRLKRGPLPDDGNNPIASYIVPSIISDDFSAPDFKGGALNGVDQLDIFNGIVSNRKSDKGDAAVIDPRFSVLGGFGTTRARFDNKKSTLINTISMGRTVTYTVERVGRIGCHWNHAKHVIVYERTVVPSRQFYLDQQRSAFRGMPLVRKVEEYVEFLEAERIYATEAATPQAAFAKGFKCGERKRISVDSAWGSVVPGQGWKVPLWNPVAAQVMQDVYPKPQLYLEVSTPEQKPESTDDNLQFISRDCLLTHPEEVVFYTSTIESNANTDLWKAVEGVDCVGYPLLTPDATVYDGGDLNAKPLPELPTPPGWEPVTFTIEPPPTGVHTTDGIVKTKTPLASQLTKVTVCRSAKPRPTSARDLLAKDATGLQAYAPNALSLATIPQTFASLRATIAGQITQSSAAQTVTEITNKVEDLKSACTNLQTGLPAAFNQLENRLAKPLYDAAAALNKQIAAQAQTVNTALGKLNADLALLRTADPSTVVHTAESIVKASHLMQTFQSTQNEITGWIALDQNKLNNMVRAWSTEIESVVCFWSAHLNQPIGNISPLRQVVLTFSDFHSAIKSLRSEVSDLLAHLPPAAAQILDKTQIFSARFDSALTGFSRGLATLQHAAQQIDPSLMLLAFNTSGIAAKLQNAVQAALQATADTAHSSALRATAVSSLQNVKDALDLIETNLNQVDAILQESTFDLLLQSPTIKSLYTDDLPALKLAIQQIGARPDVFIAQLQTSCIATINVISTSTKSAIERLADLVVQWIGTQTPLLVGSLTTLLGQLAGLNVDLSNLQQLQSKLDGYADQVHGAVESAGQTLNQYVRAPLMALYQPVATEAAGVLRVVRAFGAPPQVPHLDIQPPAIGYVYDYLNSRVPITPILARANQIGQALNALGINLPSTHLAEALVPAELRNFNLTEILPNFSGLRLPGLFSGIKLPEIANRNISVTHGWESQTRRGWLQADVDVPFTDHMVVFQAGFLSFSLSQASFKAQCRIENDGPRILQSTHGTISGTWAIEISDGNSLIAFAETDLVFDDTGKLQFRFKPSKMKLSDALKSVTALIQTFSDPESGFTYGATQNGVKCAFALPVPDTAALTSGFTGLKFSTSLALDFADAFLITLSIGVSSKDRPFNFAIFILGGCGYLEAGVTYNVDTGKFSKNLDLAVGCSASLAIALGPISGGVYAQFAIELRSNAAGFRTAAFFQITGHVSILGIISVDLVFRLEASYGGGVMIATGHFSITIKLFMFSVSVSRDVSMRLGSNGQSNATRQDMPAFQNRPPANEVAALGGPDGFVPGLADAFASTDTFAQRYVSLLL